MSLFDRRTELYTGITNAVKGVIERLNSDISKNNIYAFVFYVPSGYCGVGVSYSTRSDYQKLVNALDDQNVVSAMENASIPAHLRPQYLEVTACEWEGIGAYSELFEDVELIIEDSYDELYDTGIDPDTINGFFEDLLLEILKELRSTGCFSGPAFQDDILSGIQFPDPEDEECEVVRRISKEINSEEWHKKICDVYASER